MSALADARATIARTPGVLRALLEGLDDAAATRRYAPGSFSPYHVLGHLVINEREDWVPRIRIILEHGEARPFDAFDHNATIEPSDGPPAAELLEEFVNLRAESVAVLDGLSLTAADLERAGTHPSLGRVTLGELVSAWAAHDLHHTSQICKGLAGRYAERVGPWRDDMGILRPPAR